MPGQQEKYLLKQFKKWSVLFCYCIVLVGLLILAGWLFSIDILIRPIPGAAAMNPLTAICFTCCSCAFLLITRPNKKPRLSYLGYGLTVLVLLFSILKINGGWLFPGLQVDQWFFTQKVTGYRNNRLPSEMAYNTAVCFLLCGIALLLYNARTINGRWFQYLSLAVFTLSLFSLMGYAYAVPEFYNLLRHLPMSVHTAGCFLLFSLALLFSNAHTAFLKILSGNLEGNRLARLLLPATLVVPIALGGIRLMFQALLPVSVQLGVTLLILSIILVFTSLMWVNLLRINKRDLQQKKTELKFRALLEAAPDAIVIVNHKGVIQLINAQTEKMFGYSRDELVEKEIEVLLPAGKRKIHREHRDNYFHHPKSRGMGEGMVLTGITKNRVEFYVEVSLSPLQTEEGLLVSAAIRDVSDRKQLEKQLKQFNIKLEREVKLKTAELSDMMERIADSFMALDKNLNITYVNTKMLAETGYSKKTLVGMPVTDVIPAWPAYQKACQAMQNQQYITYSHHEEPANRWLEYHIYPSPIGLSVFTRDITEQKKAEARILEAEKRYQQTLDTMIEGCQIIDYNWRYTYINPVAARQGQSQPENLLGRRMQDVYPGIEKTTLFETLTDCMEQRHTRQIENKFMYGDGSSNWFELRIQPAKEGIFILSIDITDRKIAEEKIQVLHQEIIHSERRFRGMIENGNDLVLITNEQFVPFYRSPNFERITGWPMDEPDGREPSSFVHPEDWPGISQVMEKVVQHPGQSYSLSFRMKHKSGSLLWMEGIATNLLQEEYVKGIVYNLRDISQRKESELKLANSERIYKTIASGIPGTVICLFDKEHRYLLIEGDLMPRFGFTNEQLIGQKAGDALPPGTYQQFKTHLNRVFNGETFTVENNQANLDTMTRYVPIRDNYQEVTIAMLVVIDITELKNAQRELASLNEELEHKVSDRTAQLAQVNGELESFTYSVSHDLRAPLRIIDGFADILLADYSPVLNAEGNRVLTIIKSNARRMGQLIDDLLNFSRLGRKELLLAEVNMNKLVSAVLKEQQLLGAVKTAIVCEPLLPAYGDNGLLLQVWSNLISNAVKYSSKTEHPEISIGSASQNGEQIYYIRDNGVGFDMKYAGKLFGVFQRLHKPTEFEGTGVGLALVQRIITRHGGKIWAESNPGKGAVFSFSLPIKKIQNDHNK